MPNSTLQTDFDADAFRARYVGDPERFVRQVLGVKTLWHKQVEILEAIRDHPRVAVPACHGVGKSFLGGVATWWWKLTRHPSKVIITAPGGRQAAKVLGGEVRGRFGDMARRFSKEELAWLGLTRAPTTEGWDGDPENFIMWFATKPDDAREHATRAAGWHSPHLLMIFEEAGGIAKPIWEATQGNLTDGAHVLAIGNPSDPSGVFARMCRDSATHVIRLDAYDFPRVTQGDDAMAFGPTQSWIEEMKRYWGESSGAFQWKVRGLFPTVATDTLIGYDEVRAAVERPAPRQDDFAPEQLLVGLDVARFGDDLTTIYVLRGPRIVRVEERHGQDTMATVGMLLALVKSLGMNELHARQISVDDTGVGGGVTDRLREQGWRVNAENFGSAPRSATNEERFLNRRIELWWRMREWIRTEAALSDLDERVRDRLTDDLITPKYSHKSDGRVFLEPKDDIKERVGRSPDHGDALALALAQRSRVGLPVPDLRPKPKPKTFDDMEDERDDEVSVRDRAFRRKYGSLADYGPGGENPFA